jgi:Dolichyl-phosphate-mannose-protein mannosyltransferase
MALGLLIVASVATLAFASALCTRPRTAVELALSTVVVGYAWLVLASLSLSAFGAFDAAWLATVSAVGAVGAASGALSLGARQLPFEMYALVRHARALVSSPRVAGLCVIAGIAMGYTLALLLFTPAAEVDALAYHITRAAFWVQNGAIGPVPGAHDARIDESPPGAEILMAVTMLVSNSFRLVGLVQWLSVLVAVVAVAGIARRLGAESRPAWFAGLLIAPLPIVTLQAPTGLNDIVVAALAAVAIFFVLGERSVELVLAGIAVGCLLLTKVTGFVAIPVILGVMLLAQRGRARGAGLLSVAAGTAAGATWLVSQHSDAGTGAVGGVDTSYGGSLDIVRAGGRMLRLTTELFELPGAVGADALLFPIAAILAAIVCVVAGSRGRALLPACALIAVTPALILLAELAARAHRKMWFALGRKDVAFLDVNRPVDAAGATGSWNGAVGLAVVVLGLIVAIRSIRKRKDPVLTLLAVAPVIWIAGFALVLGYSPYEGRYMLPGLLLGAAATAALLYRPTVAWWAIAISGLTLVLVWTHSYERPAGIRLLEGGAPASAWTRDDAVALGQARALPEAIRFVSSRIPPDAHLAIWPAPFPDPPTPDPVALLPVAFFGPNLHRHLTYARSLAEAGRLGAEWALLPRFITTGCHDGWRRETASTAAYQAFRREASARCP